VCSERAERHFRPSPTPSATPTAPRQQTQSLDLYGTPFLRSWRTIYERLDALWQPMYARALTGDHGAVDRCLRIPERRAAINGLDAPVKIRRPVITEVDIQRAIGRLERETADLEGSDSAG
jgi:hypothetical protein